MDEFKILKNMLERTGAELKITVWKFIDDILIEDTTNHVNYWFHGNLLEYIDNTKEE